MIFNSDLIHSEPTELYIGSFPFNEFRSNHSVILDFSGDSIEGYELPEKQLILKWPFIDIEDTEEVPSQEQVEQFLFIAHTAISQLAGSSLWHCTAGVNRSCFMAATYLHAYRGLSIEEAIALIREKRRGWVLSNHVFEQILIERYSIK